MTLAQTTVELTSGGPAAYRMLADKCEQCPGDHLRRLGEENEP